MTNSATRGNQEKYIKRLYLSKDKKWSGVCAGIAEYFSIDPSIVRLGWIIITILTGVVPGIIAYFVAAIVIPVEPATNQDQGGK